MNVLLVLTVGQTDVQLVTDATRSELHKDRCAALHDEIERRASEWRLVDAPVPKTTTLADSLPAGAFTLCTPKVDAVLRAITPTSVLVLETRRDQATDPKDPRFAGAVVEARLRAKGVTDVRRVTYLRGKERLEGRSNPRDAVIRREVARTIEEEVRRSLGSVRADHVVVATTGGFPGLAFLVEETVKWHSAAPVEIYEVADGSRESPPVPDRAVPRVSIPEPALSFQARRRALELVHTGHLLGAWAVAEPLDSDPFEREWTQVAKWLALFASSLPMSPECDIAVLTHQRMAVRAALRVEFALRAGDIPKAVHGTVAFSEAALWDHLLEKARRHATKRQYCFAVAPPPALIRETDPAMLARLRTFDQQQNRDRPFAFAENRDGSDWYWIDDSAICAVQLAEKYLGLKALTNLSKAISHEVRELRNDVAHNEPTPALMDQARDRMKRAGLWSTAGQFLTQPKVEAVLREMNVPDPASLCDALVADVRSRLMRYVVR